MSEVCLSAREPLRLVSDEILHVQPGRAAKQDPAILDAATQPFPVPGLEQGEDAVQLGEEYADLVAES